MWSIASASAQGQVYFNEGRNNQDVAKSWTNGKVALGIINDGCHGPNNPRLQSEVGAQLSNNFLFRKAGEELVKGTKPSLIPRLLFPAYVDYLWWQVESQLYNNVDEKINFISQYLMCTTIALLANDSEVTCFWAGDGLIYLNDVVYRILNPESLNRPKYPAYHLCEMYGETNAEISSLLPNGFEQEDFSADSVVTAGISSDGFSTLPHLMDELKTHSQSSFSLQMCLNRIAVIRSETSDNVSTVFLNRVES